MKRFFCLLFALTMTASLCACSQSAPTWKEQYDLGIRYLEEGKYEEAIIAFTAAIDIEPHRPDAYRGLASAYLKTGDMERAREILQQGIDATGDSALNEYLADMLADTEPVPAELDDEGAVAAETEAASPGEMIVAGGALTLISETPQYGILRVYRGVEREENRFVKGEELTADDHLTADDYVIFDVADITDGYQIEYVGWEQEGGTVVDLTNGFVNGVYGTMGTSFKPGVWTLRMGPK